VRVGGLLLLTAAATAAASGCSPTASRNHVPPPALEGAIRKGREFLFSSQNADGSWGSARCTKDLNISAPVPGAHLAFRAACSALCLSSLISTSDGSGAERAALGRGEAWLLENLPQVRRPSTDVLYNVWTHAYALKTLLALRRLPGDEIRLARIETEIRHQIDRLSRNESVDGGWGYYDMRTRSQKPGTDSTSFITATALLALREARDAGFEVPQTLVDRALASLRRQRKPDLSYLYGEYLRMRPLMGINVPAGSLGRSQTCNAALRCWGDPSITDDRLEEWLDRLVNRNGWLDRGRKFPVPHESWFGVAGYFFYYGHYYAGYCIDLLPEDRRQRHRDALAGILVPLQEKDGRWWDYPLYDYGPYWGTPMALMALARCRPAAAHAP